MADIFSDSSDVSGVDATRTGAHDSLYVSQDAGDFARVAPFRLLQVLGWTCDLCLDSQQRSPTTPLCSSFDAEVPELPNPVPNPPVQSEHRVPFDF